jgi:enolase-phosphatase E1
VSLRAAGIGGVLLDIEGTTTPPTFVTEVLFPYARTHLRSHLEQFATSDNYASVLTHLRHEHRISLERHEAPPAWTDGSTDARIASVVAFVEWLMDRDRKSTPLKELQGLIWEAGYQRGALVGQVFPDVAPALRRWREQQVSACIYSSGSALAQQLLFRHSSAGDLTPLLHSFFDTNVGAKIEPGSYRRIAQRWQRLAETIMFLSDSPRELDAAGTAGMHVRLVIRPGNTPLPEGADYDTVHSFDEI